VSDRGVVLRPIVLQIKGNRVQEAAKHLSSDDARARELIRNTELGSLNRATDTIERTQAGGSAAWRVI
jgi:hypothetical protein